ncbi:MAG: FeoA family protein [archaeon]
MIALSECRQGKKVCIHCVSCGRGFTKRLCELGLYDGTQAEVLMNDTTGPMILKVKDSKLVLGRGQARKITVQEL